MAQNQTTSINFEAFKQAYRNFDIRPLSGQQFKDFYVEEVAGEGVGQIVNTIELAGDSYEKLLVIGHRGCGKSTLLRKVAQKLENKYHIVLFSAKDVIDFEDVKTIDLLLSTYMQVLLSMKDEGIDHFLSPFEKMLDTVRQRLELKEVGVRLLGALSFKIRTEKESRSALRENLQTQLEILHKNLSRACGDIYQQTEKEVLVIIDDLDKLKPDFAAEIFFDNINLLMMPEVKIVYTHPLDTYYSPAFLYAEYTDQFISPINLRNKADEEQPVSLENLQRLVLKRIDQELIEEEALTTLIEHSGGLLRDLVKFMRSACKKSIDMGTPIINQTIAEEVIKEHANEYERLFDFLNYETDAREIMETRKVKKIEKTALTYLVRYLFVLEYRQQDTTWFDVHPCLKKVLLSED